VEVIIKNFLIVLGSDTTIASALDSYKSCITVLSDNSSLQTQTCLNKDSTQLFRINNGMIVHIGTQKCLTGPFVMNPMNITTQVWAKPLYDGSIAVVAFNRGNGARDIPITWDMIGLNMNTAANLRDLWKHQDIGLFTGKYTPNVPSHDVSMIRVIPVKLL